MLENTQLDNLLVDISPQVPCGENPKYNEKYEEITSEIDKLTLLTSNNDLDYDKVEKLCVEVLCDDAKDLSSVLYLSYALTYNNGIAGFIQSVQIIKSVSEKYWQGMFPPLKRAKARASLFKWWITKIEKKLESLELDKTIDDTIIENFGANLNFIDDLFEEYLDDFALPSVSRNFKGIIDSKIMNLASSQPEVSATKEAIEETKPEIQKEESQEAPAEKQQVQNTPKPAPVQQTIDVNIPDVNSVASGDTVKLMQTYKECLQSTKKVLNKLMDNKIYTKDLFCINRIDNLFDIEFAPSNSNGETMLKAPEDYEKSMLENLYNSKSWDDLLINSEKFSSQYIFWLDTHFYVSKALENLNLPQEKDIVDAMMKSFLTKVGKNILDFTFNDNKTNFASADTKVWLNSLFEAPQVEQQQVQPQMQQQSQPQNQAQQQMQQQAQSQQNVTQGLGITSDGFINLQNCELLFKIVPK